MPDEFVRLGPSGAFRNPNEKNFETWARKNNMKPVIKVTDKEGDILIADSGQPFETRDEEGRLIRVYRTGFAIMRGRILTGTINDYKQGDPEYVGGNNGQQMRIDDCLIFARKQMADCLSVGLYDGIRRISYPQN